jgi:pimeloyl-ACP methyl ester carboxylesterase
MNATSTGTIRMPGTTLYYEKRGTGPLLLMIPPGGAGADAFTTVADSLAANHTVLTYDRRGYARSPLDAPEGEQDVETHAEDACHLLAAFTGEAADVFGSSGTP